MHYLNYITFGLIAIIISYQFFYGIKGLIVKSEHLAGFQFFLFLFFLSTEISRPFFPIYVKSFSFDIEETLKMALPQIFWGLGVLISTPYAWNLCKKIGSYDILRWSAFITFLSLFGMGFTHDYIVMLLLRSINSICFGMVCLVGVVYLMNIDTRAGIIKFFLYSLAFASIAGSAIGGFLAKHFSYEEVIILSSIVAAISFFVLDRCYRFEYSKIKEQAKSSYRQLLTNVSIQVFSILTTLPYRFILTGFVLYFIPVFMTDKGYSIDKVGQTVMIYFLIGAILLDPIARILDKYGLYRTLYLVSTFLISLSLIAFYYFFDNYLYLLLIVAALSVGMSISNSLQIPIVPVVLDKQCAKFGVSNIIAYMRTVERVGSVLGALVTSILYKMYAANLILILGYCSFILSIALIMFFLITKKS